MTPLLHMVCGGVGAGKTTYARKLADEIGGLRFSIDEWMTSLFGPDSATYGPLGSFRCTQFGLRCDAALDTPGGKTGCVPRAKPPMRAPPQRCLLRARGI